MTDNDAIDKEARRRALDETPYLSDGHVYIDRFCLIRAQLIKENWQPMDEADQLYDKLTDHTVRTRNQDLVIIRAALAKARRHPQYVIDAAISINNPDCGRDFADALAKYILKDLP